MKKIISILLCLFMLLTALSACKKADDPVDEPPPTEEVDDDVVTPPPSDIPADHDNCVYFCYVDAYNAFSPNEVMFTADGHDATWEQLFFSIFSSLNAMIENYGEITDWSQIEVEGQSYEDSVKEYAVLNLLMFIGAEIEAARVGITLGPEDYEDIQGQFEYLVENNGGEEAFMSILWYSDGIRSREMFDYLLGVSRLTNNLFAEMYGANGELVTDEVAAARADELGYLMAKHIIIETLEGDSSEAYATAEDILRQLNAYDGDDIGELFDQLMAEHSEDPGIEMFPEGYLFKYTDMLEEFSSATEALEVGEISGIVETEFGLHIIYRLPINYDEFPMAFVNAEQYVTLRYAIASELFDDDMFKWSDLLDPAFTPAYNSISFDDLFNPCEYTPE